MALTDLSIKKAKPRGKRYKLYDEKGLFLEIPPTGAKRWRYRYRRPGTGKENLLSFGVYPDVSLKAARDKRDEARALLADGIDPGAMRQMQKFEAKKASEGTFQAVAEAWREHYLSRLSESHQTRTWGILRNNLFPYIGKRPIQEIKAPELLRAVRIAENRGVYESAKRAVQVAGQVFRFGITNGYCEHDPTPALKGALRPHTVKHMAASTNPEDVAGYLRAFDAFSGSAVVATAIRLLPLLFCRPGELRTMRWEDVNLKTKEWRYITSKTKTEQTTPLSVQAVELLETLYPLTGHLPGGWVFPGGRTPLKPLSEAAINAAYRRLGIDTKQELTGHGWRAIARTLLSEKLGFPPEVIEQQLAHRVPDALGRAYNRTRFIEQRRDMMQAWADYLDRLKAGEVNVVELAGARNQ